MTKEIHRTGIERELPCKLTTPELLEIAISKANAEEYLEEQQAKLEDLKREHGNAIKETEKNIARMGQELRTREQRRPVECFERWRDGGTLEVVRSDTGEVIDVRVATLRDKQGELPTDSEPAPATDAQTGFDEDDEDEEKPAEKTKRGRKR